MAADVLEYNEQKGLDIQSTLKIYFHYLYQDGVRTFEQLISMRPHIIEKSNEYIDADFERMVDNVDLFYDVYKEGNDSDPLVYGLNGIKKLDIVIHPLSAHILPLDIIFFV